MMPDEKAIAIVEEPKQITPVRRSILTISQQQVERIKLLAGMMAESALEYRKMKSGDIFIKMMKGIEIGLEPVASMDLIDVIQGKPTLKPQGMLALAWGSGLMQSLSITDDGKQCTVKMQRVGSPAHVEIFSADDAKAMGLSGKDNWKKQPATMRKWRAVSAACRIVFPDIIQGMYIPEEISPDTTVDEGGEIVEAEYQNVQPTPTDTAPEETPEVKPEDNGRPAVWVLKATHMCYIANGQKYLGFANCDPVKDPDTENATVIRAYGRSTTVKGWLGEGVYNDLKLGDYDKTEKTTQFVRMTIPVEFEYIQQTTKAGEMYLEAIGIVGNDESF